MISSKAKLLWPPYTSIQAITFLFSLFFFFISVFLPYYIFYKSVNKIELNWIELNYEIQDLWFLVTCKQK